MAIDQTTWTGLQVANPWWTGGKVPGALSPGFRREAFPDIYAAFRGAEAGRGIVLLGPRRVGKTTVAYQVVQQLLADGVPPADVCLVAFDDPALKFEEIGPILDLYQTRMPAAEGTTRYLILDEVQYAEQWPLWLKRIADRKLPYRFLATGSAATALRRGGASAGLGRWRDMVLYPLSFREFVRLRGADAWTFKRHDAIEARLRADPARGSLEGALELARAVERQLGEAPPDETDRLQAVLEEYLLRGGFPELAAADLDLREARRRLRQDILERALGRDLLDATPVHDPRTLERMFLRIARAPGGLWNESSVAGEFGISRPTVSRYLAHLEDAYLVFRLPNLAKPERGQPKIYLVDPALRQALLGIDRDALVQPEIYGPVLENAVASALKAAQPAGSTVGFWRDGKWECDAVLLAPGAFPQLFEVKRTADARHDLGALERAARALGKESPVLAWLLHGAAAGAVHELSAGTAIERHPATWLYTFHPPAD